MFSQTGIDMEYTSTPHEIPLQDCCHQSSILPAEMFLCFLAHVPHWFDFLINWFFWFFLYRVRLSLDPICLFLYCWFHSYYCLSPTASWWAKREYSATLFYQASSWLCCTGIECGPIRETSSHASRQETLVQSHLSWLSHCGRVLP